MKRIIWRWKANILDYVGKPGVDGVKVSLPFPKDSSLFGRDGWVGYIEEEENEIRK